MPIWKRTCQECGFVDASQKPPKGYDKGNPQPSDAYLNKQCPRCKSEGFDFGSYQQSELDQSEMEEE